MHPPPHASALVAFFAHPDDEAYSCGGTLAAAAGRGLEVYVLCATDGEGGRARDGAALGELGARRRDELSRSCAALGIHPPRFLSLPDGGLPDHGDRLRALLEGELRELKPAAAITMGPDGAYGHRDHLACTAALTDVADAPAQPLTVLHTVFPPQAFAELRRRLQRAPVALAPPPESELPADYRVDTRLFRAQKLASLAAHRSQLIDDDPMSFLLPGLVEPLLDQELYRHAAGPELRGALAELFEAA